MYMLKHIHHYHLSMCHQHENAIFSKHTSTEYYMLYEEEQNKSTMGVGYATLEEKKQNGLYNNVRCILCLDSL